MNVCVCICLCVHKVYGCNAAYTLEWCVTHFRGMQSERIMCRLAFFNTIPSRLYVDGNQRYSISLLLLLMLFFFCFESLRNIRQCPTISFVCMECVCMLCIRSVNPYQNRQWSERERKGEEKKDENNRIILDVNARLRMAVDCSPLAVVEVILFDEAAVVTITVSASGGINWRWIFRFANALFTS